MERIILEQKPNDKENFMKYLMHNHYWASHYLRKKNEWTNLRKKNEWTPHEVMFMEATNKEKQEFNEHHCNKVH
jgi:hypothetical protein